MNEFGVDKFNDKKIKNPLENIKQMLSTLYLCFMPWHLLSLAATGKNIALMWPLPLSVATLCQMSFSEVTKFHQTFCLSR